MTKGLARKDRKALLDEARRVRAAPGDAVEWSVFKELATRAGRSLDNPEDGWTMAFILFQEYAALLRVILPKPKRAGRKPTLNTLARDAIMMVSVQFALRDGDARGEKSILRELAMANGWPDDSPAIETLWRRYQELKKPVSRERKALAKALREDGAFAAVAGKPQPVDIVPAPVMQKFRRDSA